MSRAEGLRWYGMTEDMGLESAAPSISPCMAQVNAGKRETGLYPTPSSFPRGVRQGDSWLKCLKSTSNCVRRWGHPSGHTLQEESILMAPFMEEGERQKCGHGDTVGVHTAALPPQPQLDRRSVWQLGEEPGPGTR